MRSQRRAGRLVAVAVVAGSFVGVLGAQVRGIAPRGLQPDNARVAPTTQPVPSETRRATTGGDERTDTAQLVSGLIGSKHDFRRLNAEVRDLCLPCHTPHVREAPVPRLDRRPTATQPLRAYRQLDVELSGWSLLCLGCHDGVTAPDVYTSTHAVTLVEPLRRTGLGSRGLRSHPVGVKYPTGRTDYHPSAAVEASGLMLPDGRIQCTTCHDAHNTRGYDGFLWISNQRSTLCLTCHRL
jgi:predicted CXXCH cytochrome family protein